MCRPYSRASGSSTQAPAPAQSSSPTALCTRVLGSGASDALCSERLTW